MGGQQQRATSKPMSQTPLRRSAFSTIIHAIHADMVSGDLSWDIGSLTDIRSAGIDPATYLDHDELAAISERDLAAALDEVDQWIARRVTLGPDDARCYHLTSIEGDILTADHSPSGGLYLTIDGVGCGDITLDGGGVDGLIAGLIRWRKANPDA